MYKKLRNLIADPAKLQRLSPLCDATRLQDGFAKHSGWLDKLRDSGDENGKQQKGIRDIMEHHPVTVSIHHAKTGDGPWQVLANLGDPSISADFRPNLIPTLKEIVAGVANLWTEVCSATGLKRAERPWSAPYGDFLFLTGNDDDSTGFWPEI